MVFFLDLRVLDQEHLLLRRCGRPAASLADGQGVVFLVAAHTGPSRSLTEPLSLPLDLALLLVSQTIEGFYSSLLRLMPLLCSLRRLLCHGLRHGVAAAHAAWPAIRLGVLGLPVVEVVLSAGAVVLDAVMRVAPRQCHLSSRYCRC